MRPPDADSNGDWASRTRTPASCIRRSARGAKYRSHRTAYATDALPADEPAAVELGLDAAP